MLASLKSSQHTHATQMSLHMVYFIQSILSYTKRSDNLNQLITIHSRYQLHMRISVKIVDINTPLFLLVTKTFISDLNHEPSVVILALQSRQSAMTVYIAVSIQLAEKTSPIPQGSCGGDDSRNIQL